MMWSLVLLAFCEQSKEDAAAAAKRAEKQAEKKKDTQEAGDSLAAMVKPGSSAPNFLESSFQKNWKLHGRWVGSILDDALAYVRDNEPRVNTKDRNNAREEKLNKAFYGSVWGPLEGRGWKEEVSSTGTLFRFREHKVSAEDRREVGVC